MSEHRHDWSDNDTWCSHCVTAGCGAVRGDCSCWLAAENELLFAIVDGLDEADLCWCNDDKGSPCAGCKAVAYMIGVRHAERSGERRPGSRSYRTEGRLGWRGGEDE